MKTELELPPLPEGWADGPVEIKYGVPTKGSLTLTLQYGNWIPSPLYPAWQHVYAVRKWQPAIVTAGVLAPGWVVIDPHGTYFYSRKGPWWCDENVQWAGVALHCLCVLETPQITGRNAIWEIK